MFDERVSILIPFKSDGGYRDKNCSWIKERYEILMPNAEICIGSSDIEPFSRSASINNAAKLATRDIFIICDGDMVFDVKQIEKALTGLDHYTWIIPFISTNMLTLEQTSDMLKKDPSIIMSNIDFTGCENFVGSVGQINIVPQKYFEQIRGFDERFKGWGFEDNAFQISMDTLCGPHARLKTSMWHLYHPTAPQSNYQNNYELFNRVYGSKESIINDFKPKSGG